MECVIICRVSVAENVFTYAKDTRSRGVKILMS